MFTEEELDTEFEFVITIKDDQMMKIVKSKVDILPEPFNKGKKVYKITLPLRDIFDIVDEVGEPFGIDVTDNKKWREFYNRIPKQQKDTSKPQGFLDDLKSQSYASGFSLESVEGQVMPGALPTNTPITFKIRLNK